MRRRVRSSNKGHTEWNLAVSSARLSMLRQHNNHQPRMLPLFLYGALVETAGDKTTYTVTDGTNTISLPIRWSFGAGGRTWILEYQGKLYDSLVSYYPAIEGLDITMGEERNTPHTVE